MKIGAKKCQDMTWWEWVDSDGRYQACSRCGFIEDMDDEMKSSTIRQELDKNLTLYNSAHASVEVERESLFEVEERLTCSEESRKVFQEVSQTVQQMAHSKIASVVSRCLEAVFDDPYEFKIIFDTKRGRTEARLLFLRDGVEIDPMFASGGGVIDVASFALRLACLSLSRPPLRKLLVLDEPFKFVSQDYRKSIRSLLETLAEEMNFQLLFVTHIPDLQCGKVITVD